MAITKNIVDMMGGAISVARVRSTASLPEVVQSERIPMVDSILVTLEQVLKSSSATSARSPLSWGISSCRTGPPVEQRHEVHHARRHCQRPGHPEAGRGRNSWLMPMPVSFTWKS